jgi:hypothetical protein
MNVNTWNLFGGLSEVLLICLAAVGFMSVVVVIVTAGRRVNKEEVTLTKTARLQTLEPEESVLDIEN